MDYVFTGRLERQSLWLHHDAPIDGSEVERLHSVLTRVASVTHVGPTAVETTSRAVEAGDPSTLTYRHQRGFLFELEGGVRSSWVRCEPSIPARDHLSWLAFVHVWSTVFDRVGFSFGTVQARVPDDEFDRILYTEPAPIYCTAGKRSRDQLLYNSLYGGFPASKVDRWARIPRNPHLCGRAVSRPSRR